MARNSAGCAGSASLWQPSAARSRCGRGTTVAYNKLLQLQFEIPIGLHPSLITTGQASPDGNDAILPVTCAKYNVTCSKRHQKVSMMQFTRASCRVRCLPAGQCLASALCEYIQRSEHFIILHSMLIICWCCQDSLNVCQVATRFNVCWRNPSDFPRGTACNTLSCCSISFKE